MNITDYDAWLVQCETCGYLADHSALPLPLGRTPFHPTDAETRDPMSQTAILLARRLTVGLCYGHPIGLAIIFCRCGFFFFFLFFASIPCGWFSHVLSCFSVKMLDYRGGIHARTLSKWASREATWLSTDTIVFSSSFHH